MEPSLILVGIDFSDAAARAVAWARDLACWTRSRLLALHVADRDDWAWTPELRSWLERQGLATADVTVRTGTPWLHLARYADEIRPALLVVGSHGQGGFHPVAPGSTTSMVITRVRIPVLVVPPTRSGAGPPAAAPARAAQPEPERGAAASPETPDTGRPFSTESNRS